MVFTGRGGVIGQIGPGTACLVDQPLQQVMGALDAFLFDDGGEGIQPLTGFLGIYVGGGNGHLGVSPVLGLGSGAWKNRIASVVMAWGAFVEQS
jgi:hypothetical protein